MKKTPKKVTFQTLDKKIDGIAGTVGTLSDTVGTLSDTVGKLSDTVGTLSDTVDSLARSTKEGFDRMNTFQAEMTDFAKKTGMALFNLDSHARTTNERLDAIEKTLGPLVQVSSVMQKEIRELNSRVTKLEHHIGIKS